MDQSEETSYLLSFLAILIDRNGGELEINNLSEYAGKNIFVKMEKDFENDRVVLRTADSRRTVWI